MVTVVIVLNLVIAVLCLYAARKIWRVGRILSVVANTLTNAEQSTHAVLANAPEKLIRGQLSTHQLRQQYQQLELQLQKAQQVLALMGLSQWVWQWYTRRRVGALQTHHRQHPRRSLRRRSPSLSQRPQP